MLKPIRISAHAQQQSVRRGILAEEIIAAIHTAEWQPAQGNRLECLYNFLFNDQWNGKFYQTKQVRPIFVDETEEIVVITVYSYYF